MAAVCSVSRRRHGLQRWRGIVLFLFMKTSCGFNMPSTVSLVGNKGVAARSFRGITISAQQVEGASADGDDDERINGDSETSLPSSTYCKRCPDFPAFAFRAGEGVGGDTKVRVRRQEPDGSTEPDTISWVYKAAAEFPVEPGFFLDVANSARRTRLLKSRSYASPSAFAAANITCPPSLADLDREPSTQSETFWISTPARFLALASSIWAFPFIIQTLNNFVTLPPEKLNEISASFGPGVSIIYGTFVSLTLSVLYNRQQYIQDDVAQESALLTVICRNLLTLFANDKELAVESTQTVADQIRTLVKGSRGSELTLLMYSDPYSRMLELISVRECQLMSTRNGDLGGQGVSRII